MTQAGAFTSSEVALAAGFAFFIEMTLFLLLALTPSTAHIVEREEVVKKEEPIAVQPVLDLPMLKKGSKKLKMKLPDMWVKKPPIKRFEAKSAPTPLAEDEPLEKPIESELAKLDETPPPPDAAVAKQVDEQVEQIEETKPEEDLNLPEEGAADGVKEGTEKDPLKAFAVSQYKMKISAWFNVRFKRPDEIPCEELKKLRASVIANIGPNRTVTGFSVVKPSGNGVFDQRVESTLSSIRSQGSELPPPPPNYPDILGTTINVGFFVPSCD